MSISSEYEPASGRSRPAPEGKMWLIADGYEKKVTARYEKIVLLHAVSGLPYTTSLAA